MKKIKHRFLITTVLLFVFFTSNVVQAQQGIAIIPQPVSVKMNEGTFQWDQSVSLAIKATDKDLKDAAQYMINAVATVTGKQMRIGQPTKKQVKLELVKEEQLGEEGYHIKVVANEIRIAANNKKGIMYGIQSLLQLFPAERTNTTIAIPCTEITDYPRFAWRGMHLDVSRHFFGPELIRDYIDLLYRYKINTFHWHLVDDQGWRIEIKKYPKLTTVGAWRANKNHMVWGTRPQATADEKADYGGYYTQEQIKELVAYARERNITIVPEIEMPGHVASAIAAYPQFSCNQQPQLPLTGGNYTGMSSNYCAGSEEVFRFNQDVLDEVLSLFPSSYIHIGGDEVDKTPWKNCANCQKRMQTENLKNEEELQSYFIKRIEKYLTAKGRKLMGWDEILEGGLADGAAVMSWRGESGGIQAAKMNHLVVMTPGNPYYFDHYQAGPEGEPLAIGGMNTLKKVYEYDPVPASLPVEKAKYILGGQANLWTEYITHRSQLEYMLLPRLLALSEGLWSTKATKDWDGFTKRLKPHFSFFDTKGYQYSKGSNTVTITPETANGAIRITLKNEITGSEIKYTLDGSDPGTSAIAYQQPFAINKSTTVKAATFLDGARASSYSNSMQFAFSKATGRNINYQQGPSQYYMADGNNTLTDGIRGTYALNKYWHGFSGRDMIATVDLGAIIPVQKIALGCLQSYGDWVFMPQWVKFEISEDGINYKEAGTAQNPVDVNQRNKTIHDFAVSTKESARYIRITAKVIPACPKGHSGEGKPGWIFCDEIIVE